MRIRNFGVGLIALVTVAAASLFYRQRRITARLGLRRGRLIVPPYAAGL